MKRLFLPLIILALTVFATSVSAGQEVEFTWDEPELREDGTQLEAGEVTSYVLYEESQDDDDILPTPIAVIPASNIAYSHHFQTYGEKCFSIASVNRWDDEGKRSEQVCLLVKPALPDAPTLSVIF